MSARTSALRRRRKASLATRLKVAWVFIAVTVVAAAYASYLLVTLPQLRVSNIDVHVNGLNVRESDVLAAANVDRRANLWLLDTRKMARQIERIPYVGRAAVARMPVAKLTIVVTEREPDACVRRGIREVTLDREQRILQDGCARASAIRIVVRSGTLGRPGSYAASPELAALLADGRALRDARVAVRSIGEDRFGQLVATQQTGIQLLFGNDSDLAQKAKLVEPVLAATHTDRAIRAIDLRAPATPTVEFR